MFNTLEYLNKICLGRLQERVSAHYRGQFNLEDFQFIFNQAFNGHEVGPMSALIQADLQAIYKAFKQVKDWHSAQAFLENLLGEDEPYEDEQFKAGASFILEHLLIRDLYRAWKSSRTLFGLSISERYLEKTWTKTIVKGLLTGVCLRVGEQLKEDADLKELLQAGKEGKEIDIKRIKRIASLKLNSPGLSEPRRQCLQDCQKLCEYWGHPKIDVGFIRLVDANLNPIEIKSCAIFEFNSLISSMIGGPSVSYQARQVFGGLGAKSKAISHSPGCH